MADFLDVLALDAKKTVEEGYYNIGTSSRTPSISLRKGVLQCKRAPVIPEIKPASPSLGLIRENADAVNVALAMKNGGAVGISTLTEPKHFRGSLDSFVKVRKEVELPLLMKDIIVSPVQLEAASKIGANVVLLIEPLFERGYCEYSLEEMISGAHSRNLEVLLEAHTGEEFLAALGTEADMVGINNRDLRTLKVDLNVTKKVLERVDHEEKIIVSESGIKTASDIRFLRGCGAHAFLVGSAIMTASNVEEKVRELVNAL